MSTNEGRAASGVMVAAMACGLLSAQFPPAGRPWQEVGLEFVVADKELPFLSLGKDSAPAAPTAHTLEPDRPSAWHAGGHGKDPIAIVDGKPVVDTDGDGERELTVDRLPAVVTLQLAHPPAAPAPYALRLWRDDRELKGRSSCYWQGRMNDQRIILLDGDGNGRFDDRGRDSIVIGDTHVAIPLGSRALIGDGIYEIQPSPDGTTLRVREWSGPKARSQIINEEASRAPALAIVRTGDDLFAIASGADHHLPAGSYAVTAIVIGTADQFATARYRGEPFKLTGGVPFALRFGGEPRLYFAVKNEDRDALVALQDVMVLTQDLTFTSFEPLRVSFELTLREREAKARRVSGKTIRTSWGKDEVAKVRLPRFEGYLLEIEVDDFPRLFAEPLRGAAACSRVDPKAKPTPTPATPARPRPSPPRPSGPITPGGG